MRMRFLTAHLIVILFSCASIAPSELENGFTVAFHTVPLDHFDEQSTKHINRPSFAIKYAVNYQHYRQDGPLFFHPGGQEPLEDAVERVKLLQDIAGNFHAALLFVEHRYYGESLPFPGAANESYASVDRLKYLRVRQVLADYVSLIERVKLKEGIVAVDAPVIAYGGGYSGDLATWLRQMHPNVVYGSWASTPHVRFYDGGLLPSNNYYMSMSAVLYHIPGCQRAHIYDSLVRAFDYFNLNSSHALDFALLDKMFEIDPRTLISDNDQGIVQLNRFIDRAFEGLVEHYYPYETNFGGRRLAGWALNKACEVLNVSWERWHTEPDQGVFDRNSTFGLMGLLHNFIGHYYNGSGQVAHYCIDPYVCGRDVDTAGDPSNWLNHRDIYHIPRTYQHCTELLRRYYDYSMAIELLKQRVFDAFLTNPLASDCFALVDEHFPELATSAESDDYAWLLGEPESSLLNDSYALRKQGFIYDFKRDGVGRQIFTVPELSPWSNGAPPLGAADSRKGIYVLSITAASTELDLLQPNSCDPKSVRAARFQALEILKCWAGLLPSEECRPADLHWALPVVDAEEEFARVDQNGKMPCWPLVNAYPWGEKRRGELGPAGNGVKCWRLSGVQVINLAILSAFFLAMSWKLFIAMA